MQAQGGKGSLIILVLNVSIKFPRTIPFFRMCVKMLFSLELFEVSLFSPNFYIYIMILFSHFIPLLFSLDVVYVAFLMTDFHS
jgi:hypothetical protein